MPCSYLTPTLQREFTAEAQTFSGRIRARRLDNRSHTHHSSILIYLSREHNVMNNSKLLLAALVAFGLSACGEEPKPAPKAPTHAPKAEAPAPKAEAPAPAPAAAPASAPAAEPAKEAAAP